MKMDPQQIMQTAAGQKFLWVANGEPHAIRRREILAKYGEQVRKLYGYDHKTAWVVSGTHNTSISTAV
jgi:hypothetical protein